MQFNKILALDMDGTALNDEGELTKETRKAVRLARDHSCAVCFVTGRREIDIEPIKDQCDCADYLLLDNGAKIIDVKMGKVLFQKQLDKRTKETLINYCLEHHTLLYVIAGLYWAVNYITEGVKDYALSLGSEPYVFSSVGELPVESIDGFMVTDSGAHIEEFIRRQKMPLYCSKSEPNCIDLIIKGAGKWNAVEMIGKKLSVSTDHIIAAGNYNNDIEMIRSAGIGIAVANALPEVKEAADYITTADNNNNPVLEIVKRFVLGQAE